MNMHDVPFTATLADAPDLESRVVSSDHQDIRLWLRLLSCTTFIENEIRSRLRNEFQTTLPRFDLMAQLQHESDGMKMSDLSRRLMVTNGNITGIADQLEKDGLVERTKLDTDRRSSLIKLTPKGRKLYQKISQAHESWVRTLFASLSKSSHQKLYEQLGELKTMARLFSHIPEMAN